MRTRLGPVIAKLNEIIVEHEVGLDPLAENDAEAMRLICFAKDILARANAAMEKADMEKMHDDA